MTRPEWKDQTSYSRDDKERIPGVPAMTDDLIKRADEALKLWGRA